MNEGGSGSTLPSQTFGSALRGVRGMVHDVLVMIEGLAPPAASERQLGVSLMARCWKRLADHAEEADRLDRSRRNGEAQLEARAFERGVASVRQEVAGLVQPVKRDCQGDPSNQRAMGGPQQGPGTLRRADENHVLKTALGSVVFDLEQLLQSENSFVLTDPKARLSVESAVRRINDVIDHETGGVAG